MKLLTEKEIKERSLERFPVVMGQPTNDLRFGYIEGAQETQKLLLESASEWFDEWFNNEIEKLSNQRTKQGDVTLNAIITITTLESNKGYLERIWQAATLAQSKELKKLEDAWEEAATQNYSDKTTIEDLQKENEELRKDFERIKGVAQENYNRAEKINETRTEEIKKLQKENEELKYYKEQWQSIAGKANLKNLVATAIKLERQLEIQTKRVENLKKSNEFYVDINNCSTCNEDHHDGVKLPTMSGGLFVTGKLARSCKAIDQELEKELKEVK